MSSLYITKEAFGPIWGQVCVQFWKYQSSFDPAYTLEWFLQWLIKMRSKRCQRRRCRLELLQEGTQSPNRWHVSGVIAVKLVEWMKPRGRKGKSVRVGRGRERSVAGAAEDSWSDFGKRRDRRQRQLAAMARLFAHRYNRMTAMGRLKERCQHMQHAFCSQVCYEGKRDRKSVV